jgi:hypothetical protein
MSYMQVCFRQYFPLYIVWYLFPVRDIPCILTRIQLLINGAMSVENLNSRDMVEFQRRFSTTVQSVQLNAYLWIRFKNKFDRIDFAVVEDTSLRWPRLVSWKIMTIKCPEGIDKCFHCKTFIFIYTIFTHIYGILRM